MVSKCNNAQKEKRTMREGECGWVCPPPQRPVLAPRPPARVLQSERSRVKGKEVKFEGVGGSGARRSPTFLVLQPVVLQVVLDAALELLRVVAGDQDGHEGVQGIESFLGGRRTQTGVATWQVGQRGGDARGARPRPLLLSSCVPPCSGLSVGHSPSWGGGSRSCLRATCLHVYLSTPRHLL